MAERCEKCQKWRKITDNSGQCGEDRNFVSWHSPLAMVNNISQQNTAPIVTRYDDHCKHFEPAKEDV